MMVRGVCDSFLVVLVFGGGFAAVECSQMNDN